MTQLPMTQLNQTVRFALVGTGSIAGFHAKAIGMVEGAQLVAAHSRGREAGAAFCAGWKCDYEPTLDGLLARPDVDAVCITTPSGTHAEIGIACARAGKHVLVEKPVDISVERIDALLQACEAAQVRCGAIFQARFGAGAIEAKRAMDEDRLGKLAQAGAYVPWYRSDEYYASGQWRGTWALDGGGALMNQSIHAIDLLLWLAGEVTEVSARIETRAHPIEVEDNAVAWLRFKNGALGTVIGSTCCFPGEHKRVELKGTQGSITLVDDLPVLWEFADGHGRPEDRAVRGLAKESSIGGGASDPKAISVEGHRAQIADFADALRTGREPSIPGREGRRAVELIRAIYVSSQSGRVVTL